MTKYHGAEGFVPPSVQEALEHFDEALAHDPAIDTDPFIAELQRRAEEVA